MINRKGKPAGTLHRTLLATTRSDQLMIDHMILRLDMTRREDYGLYLRVHYAALQSLKAEWRDEDYDDFSAMTRRLQIDLHMLESGSTNLRPRPSEALTPCGRVGLAFVVRGSRLGTTEIRRRVSPQFVTSYLDFTPRLSWAHFLTQLDGLDWDNEKRQQAIQGARLMLEVFSDLLKQAMA